VPSLTELLPLVVVLTAPFQQSSIPVPPAVADDRPSMTIAVTRRRHRFDYHVDNPSNFEPGPLVPHFFEQRYDADNTWISVKGEYRIGGSRAATEVGFTPRVTSSGSDIDTFFQPSGDVITSGTDGEVRIWSLSIQQWFDLASWRRWRFGITAAYRRSEMDFLPSDRIVTHSLPPSVQREPVGGDETTWSHVIASGVTASAPLAAGARWRVLGDLEALPITRARLNISLPLKYPGEILRQDTFGFSARGRLSAERQLGRLSAGGALTLGGSWGYRSSADYHERLVGGEAFVRLSSP